MTTQEFPYYIYLSIVRGPMGVLYYGGKKKDDGKEYHGSSYYPGYQSWVSKGWVQTRILKRFDNVSDQSKAETELIKKLLTKHGSYVIATIDQKHVKVKCGTLHWLRQFKPGTCLNYHASDCGTAAQGALDKLKKYGASPRQKENIRTLALLTYSPEARAKKSKSLKEYRSTPLGKERSRVFGSLTKDPILVKKRIEKRMERKDEIYSKVSDKLRNQGNLWKCSAQEGCYSLNEWSRRLGLYRTTLEARNYKLGHPNLFEYHGVVFTLVALWDKELKKHNYIR